MAGKKACPRSKSEQWLKTVKKVGPFEAYRVFIRNGYDIPSFIFKTPSDVSKYLSFIPQLRKRTDKKTGKTKWFIPYGRDYGTWTTNTSLVKSEVDRVNDIYGPLLIVRTEKPSAQQSIVEKGRTKVEWVEINNQALVEHYKVYEDPRELQKKVEDNGEMYIPDYEQRVAYNLAVTGALMQVKDIRKTIRLNDKANPYREINLRKLLSGKGVSKEQVDFIFDYMKENDISSMSTEDLAIQLASEFAYTVESDITREASRISRPYTQSDEPIGERFDFNGASYTYDAFDTGDYWRRRPGEFNATKISKEEFDKAKQQVEDLPGEPTQHYQNLTVQGGTNHTENEIRTPDITPSIKGHAQFATDKGIGWFRSDVKHTHKESYPGEVIPDDILEETGRLTKTRRVLELQSELFQKGRDKDNLINKSTEYSQAKDKITDEIGRERITEEEFNSLPGKIIPYYYPSVDTRNLPKEFNSAQEVRNSNMYQKGGKNIGHVAHKVHKGKIIGAFNLSSGENFTKIKFGKRDSSENKFLQLLNKDNNWVKFFINTIIQDSAKKGYEKVLFPKGETAAKVEGHQTLADEIVNINESLKRIDSDIKDLKKQPIRKGKVTLEIYDEDGRSVETFNSAREAADFQLRNSGWNIVGEEAGVQIYAHPEAKIKTLKEDKLRLERRKAALKSQGIEKLKPIESFYEIRVGNILKKIDPNVTTITDEHGNQWYSYTIKDTDLSKAFALQRKSEESKLDPENRADFEEKKAIMLKNFPRVTEVIEDYNMANSGTLEANGTIVKVNPDIWTTDTIGHEFGHLMLEIIGGMNNPLVAKARKQLLGSDIETFVFDKYKDLVEAQDGRIDLEIVTTAIGRETAKIFSEEKDRAAWVNLVNRILERIKKFLHIEHNAARELARMVLTGESVNTETNLDINFSEQRTAEDKIKEELNKSRKGKTKIEALRDKALEALQTKYKIYRKRDVKSKTDILEETIAKIEELDESPIEGLKLFRDFAVQQTKQVFDRYASAKRKHEAFLRGEERGKQFTLDELNRWRDYVSGFAMLEEFVSLAEKLLLESSQEAVKAEGIFGKDKESIDKIVKQLEDAVKQKKIIEEAYIEEGISLAAEKLAKHSRHIEAEFNEAAEDDYTKLSKEEQSEMSLEEYKQERIGANKEEIRELTVKLLEDEMKKASNDINIIQRWLESPFHSSDVVGSTLASAVVDSHILAREEYLDVQDELLEKVQSLEDFYKKKGLFYDIKNTYDFMLEKADDGNYTQNIISPYKSVLWDNYNKLKQKLDEEGVSYDVKQEKLKLWKKTNMPVDTNEFNKVKEAFLNDLIEKGMITKGQKNQLDVNDHWTTQPKQDVSDIVSDDAAELIHEWFRENLWKYRLPINFYKNQQYQELVKMAGGDINQPLHEQIKAVEANVTKDPRVDFYNFITNKVEKVQRGTPYGHRIHNRLPSVLKSSGERAAAHQSATKVLEYTVSNTLNVLADESERGTTILTNEAGNPVHFIPVYYTTNLKKYYSNEYDKLPDKKKKGITKEEYATKKAEENQSYDLGSIYARYFDSAINYKHKYNILPEMEFALEMVKERTLKEGEVKGLKKVFKRAKKEKAENSAKQISDWMEAIVYGIRQKDEGTIFGGKVDIAKGVNALNSFTAVNLLGLNFVQGTANALLGSAMQVVEAAGGQDYNVTDLAKANVYYGKNLPGMLGDVGLRKPKNIVSLLLRKYDILNEYDEPEFRKTSKFHQLFKTNTLFFTSQAGEHWMQTKVLLAMLIRIKAKDAQGNVLGTMLDMYSIENGKLTLDNRVANFSKQDQSVFETKVRKKLATTHGDYSPFGLVAAQRYAAGRMGYMFRKFIVPGVKKRYQRKQVDNAAGEYVEGYYRSMGRFTAQLVKDLKNFQFALMTTDWNSLKPKERANIRKALTELAFLSASMIMSSLFIGLKEDEDDEDWIWGFLAYQSLRFKTELLFFSPKLDETMKILRSPAASMSVIENLIRFYSQLLPPDFEGFERYERGSWKGRYKINKTAVNFVPGLKQIYRLKFIDDQLGWFN